MQKFHRLLLASAAIFALCATAPVRAADRADVAERLKDSAAVFIDIMAAPDKGIPQDLLERSYCVVIVPSLKKGAFVVGAQYGKGFMTCRGPNRAGWTAPSAMRIEGGSVGLQIGGSETEVVMLVMNQRGADKLLSDKFTLGAEGEVAAGPVGRTATAETDAALHAEMLSWSRTRGVFAGVALKGATLRPDSDDNEALYGKKIDSRTIVKEGVKPTPEARPLIDLLSKYSFRESRG